MTLDRHLVDRGARAIHLASLARVALEESKARGELLKNAILPSSPERRDFGPGRSLRRPFATDAGLRSILESSLYSKSVIYAAIVDTDGRVVAHQRPERRPANGWRLPMSSIRCWR